jgi:hypothetical protein
MTKKRQQYDLTITISAVCKPRKKRGKRASK